MSPGNGERRPGKDGAKTPAKVSAPIVSQVAPIREDAPGRVPDERACLVHDELLAAVAHPTRERALPHGLSAVCISHAEATLIHSGLLPDPAVTR